MQPTQSHYNAVIIGMYRQGATIKQIAASTLESWKYVAGVIEKYLKHDV